MSRLIFFETFPHTGTWFMLFFLHKHPDVNGYMPTYQLPLALAGVPNSREVLGGPNETPPLPEQLAPAVERLHHHRGPEHHAEGRLELGLVLEHAHRKADDSLLRKVRERGRTEFREREESEPPEFLVLQVPDRLFVLWCRIASISWPD